MRQLTFHPNGPKSFILAQDGAFSPFQPENDQVWELNLQGTDELPFCLQTTYGLRATLMRIFPSVIIENRRYCNQGKFHSPPTVMCYTPDSLRITCSPIPALNMEMDIFLPQIDILVGSIKITNSIKKRLNLTLELAAVLVPMGEGVPTRPAQKGINQIIVGQTGDLCPILFMTGGPSAVTNPYPALSESIRLNPNQTETWNWALATKSDEETSLNAARKVIASEWKKTSHRHIMRHASQTIDIQTGQPDWDAAFRLSQTITMTHLISEHQGSTFFLRTRLPDQFPHPPSEQTNLDNLTTLEAVHLAEVLLPSRTHLIKRVIENFIHRCDTGSLPSRRNAFDFIEPFPECPILAHLVLGNYQQDGDKRFLSTVFNDLCRLTEAWCRQVDSPSSHPILCWQDPEQLQLNTGLFAFDIWEKSGKGLDIQYVESPALISMLYQEAEAIERIAGILHETTHQSRFNERKELLKERLEETWQDHLNRFGYLDCQSHLNHTWVSLYQGVIQEEQKIDQTFKTPQRLAIHLHAADEHTRVCLLEINGKDAQGVLIKEKYKPLDIHWALNTAHITTENLYAAVDSLTIKGMKSNDYLHIETADYAQGDITCLLPIWSGGASKQCLDAMVESHLDPENARNTFGIPETWHEERELPGSLPLYVNVLWNTLIIRGLLREGYGEEAAALFSTLMSTIMRGLRDFQGFFPYYDSKTGKPVGKRNAIAGLAPIRLFLDIAGIRLFSPDRVAIWGCSPFPSPIKVQWQGLSLRREGVQTQITFPDGTVHQTDSEEPVMITP